MGLSLQATLIAALVAFGFLVVVFDLIRRHKLLERYSLVWMIASIMMLLGVMIPGSLAFIGWVTGIQDTTDAMLMLVILFLMAVVLSLSLAVSKLSESVTRLNQEVGTLWARLDQGAGASRVHHIPMDEDDTELEYLN